MMIAALTFEEARRATFDTEARFNLPRTVVQTDLPALLAPSAKVLPRDGGVITKADVIAGPAIAEAAGA